MTFTKEQLKAIIGNNEYLDDWYAALVKILPDYDINTSKRIAAFIAQCAHESGKFTAITENLNYRASSLKKVFPKYFSTDALANAYAGQPEKIANKVYANRMGNGTESSGDGWKYRGAGLIQITGKTNHQAFATSVDMPIAEVPEYLRTFEGAVQSACFFWETNKLNQYADSGDIVTLSKRINGGTNGLEDRQKYYALATTVLAA
jgi:putative chitinase